MQICPQRTRFTSNQTKEINFVMWHHVVLPVIPFSLSTAWVWIRAYQNILFAQAFWQALLWPWIILCSPLPPSRHNHTCLILSNLSFILANQLLRCALFHHLLSCDSIIFSLIPTPQPPQPPCSYPIYPLFLHLYLVVLPLSWHQGQPWPIQAPGLKQISLGLYSSTRIKNS